MLGPVATRLEERGLRPGLSASLVVILFIIAICLFAAALAAPLSFWLARLPQLWADLQASACPSSKAPLEALKSVRDQLRELTGGEGLTVSVDEGMGVESMAFLAPAVVGADPDLLCLPLFFRRHHATRPARPSSSSASTGACAGGSRTSSATSSGWFRATCSPSPSSTSSRASRSASRLYLIGIPSAALWGALAALTNFVVFIGPIVMVVILFMVGLAEFDTLGGSLLPVAVYLGINMVEAQFVTPMVIGRTMTLNPFVVVLALIFWIWLWGPLGGFIAIPALLVVYAVIRNIVPGINWGVDDIDRATAESCSGRASWRALSFFNDIALDCLP